MAISPLKSPSKITMIPVGTRSPIRIAPAVTMATRAGVSVATAKPSTMITMSPSKVVVKQAPTQAVVCIGMGMFFSD